MKKPGELASPSAACTSSWERFSQRARPMPPRVAARCRGKGCRVGMGGCSWVAGQNSGTGDNIPPHLAPHPEPPGSPSLIAYFLSRPDHLCAHQLFFGSVSKTMKHSGRDPTPVIDSLCPGFIPRAEREAAGAPCQRSSTGVLNPVPLLHPLTLSSIGIRRRAGGHGEPQRVSHRHSKPRCSAGRPAAGARID